MVASIPRQRSRGRECNRWAVRATVLGLVTCGRLPLSLSSSRCRHRSNVVNNGNAPTPYLRSGAELARAIERLDEVRLLTAGLPTVAHVPPGRVTALARFATVATAQAVTRMPEERRMATLLAFVRTLEASAQDDVLDLLDIVVTKVFADAAAVGKRARLRTIRDLDAAALKLRQAATGPPQLGPGEVLVDLP